MAPIHYCALGALHQFPWCRACPFQYQLNSLGQHTAPAANTALETI